MTRQPVITIIGAGNVATHIARALSEHATIAEVWSRDIENARRLVSTLSSECKVVEHLTDLDGDSDYYIVSVVDDAIAGVIEATGHIGGGIWVHTSGSTPMSVFEGEKERFGVFYPLQTFSKAKRVDMSVIPMLIEGSDTEVTSRLMTLAAKISNKVKPVDSEGRARLHVAAVFACNFTNFMWTLADRELVASGLDITAMLPLIEETVDKLRVMSPFDAQTGPARRGDRRVIDRHVDMLKGVSADIYRRLSDDILSMYSIDK